MAGKGTRREARLELAAARTAVTRASLVRALVVTVGTDEQREEAEKLFRLAVKLEKQARVVCDALRREREEAASHG